MTHKDPFPSQIRTGVNGEEIFIVSKDDGSVLATMTGNDLFHLDLANLFVTTHNSHDGLLEALEYLVQECDDDMDDDYNPHAAPLAKAHVAIKVARS